jgi:lipopolysaccharide/colanic/teichoic acid biosynthesis glycosyltransferase
VRNLFFGNHNIPQGFYFYAFIASISTLIFIRISGASHVAWRFFSVPDAIASGTGISTGIIVAAIAAFVYDRLQSVPRSLLLIHVLLQISGFVGIRFVLKRYVESYIPVRRRPAYALLVGCNQVSYVYARAVESLSIGSLKIIAALTHDPSMIGHRIRGINIVSIFDNIEDVLGQYKIRGIDIRRIVIAANENEITARNLELILNVASRHQILVSDIHFLFSEVAGSIGVDDDFDIDEIWLRGAYWGLKRVLDIVAALALLFLISPVYLITAFLVWKDVGKPLFFWQERPGRHGKMIRVFKFRSMKDAVGLDGVPVPDDMRTSKIGLLLRKIRLDELPQLWNIIVGDMSFIGPRPLLFVDQPEEMSQRLAVRPGVTGWAQVNGGKLVTPEQKRALDLWYISHASLLLDMKIVILTILVMFRGDVKRPQAVQEALKWLKEQEHSILLE